MIFFFRSKRIQFFNAFLINLMYRLRTHSFRRPLNGIRLYIRGDFFIRNANFWFNFSHSYWSGKNIKGILDFRWNINFHLSLYSLFPFIFFIYIHNSRYETASDGINRISVCVMIIINTDCLRDIHLDAQPGAILKEHIAPTLGRFHYANYYTFCFNTMTISHLFSSFHEYFPLHPLIFVKLRISIHSGIH